MASFNLIFMQRDCYSYLFKVFKTQNSLSVFLYFLLHCKLKIGNILGGKERKDIFKIDLQTLTMCLLCAGTLLCALQLLIHLILLTTLQGR